jgi:predicted ATP-grasp superfamily ATP-dependent carboligase
MTPDPLRIFVYEHVTGGGFAGRPLPRLLAREGLAMRTALIEDLAAIGRHDVVATMDTRVACSAPRGVRVVGVAEREGRAASAAVDSVIDDADAVWLIAPETGGCLERLTARIERRGKTVLGPAAAAVHRAADKSRLPRRLARLGIAHPETSAIDPGMNVRAAARRLGYPVVVKPAQGAGCCGVRLARTPRELAAALDAADRASGTGRLVMQRYVRGCAASVSLLANGRRAVPLVVNAQRVAASTGFSYRGGVTPFDHPLAAAAAAAASRTCAAIPGLRGYVGVDLVLTETGPVVIEVNPRLTMSYLGVRAVLEENVAAMAIAACRGHLPDVAVVHRRARFSASGMVRRS